MKCLSHIQGRRREHLQSLVISRTQLQCEQTYGSCLWAEEAGPQVRLHLPPELAPESSQGRGHHRWAGRKGTGLPQRVGSCYGPREVKGRERSPGCRKPGWRAERHGKAISRAQSRRPPTVRKPVSSVLKSREISRISNAQTQAPLMGKSYPHPPAPPSTYLRAVATGTREESDSRARSRPITGPTGSASHGGGAHSLGR